MPTPDTNSVTERIAVAQTTEERFLRQIFIRAQMTDFVRDPLLMARSDGMYYWDVKGKQYLDGLSGIYVANVGHNNRRVINAVREQLDQMAFAPVMHGSNPVAVQLANRLVDLAPGDLSAVKFASGGSETTEAAIKMARQFHHLQGRSKKIQNHLPLRILAWVDNRFSLSVWTHLPTQSPRTTSSRIHSRLSTYLLPLPLRKKLFRL